MGGARERERGWERSEQSNLAEEEGGSGRGIPKEERRLSQRLVCGNGKGWDFVQGERVGVDVVGRKDVEGSVGNNGKGCAAMRMVKTCMG